MNNGSLQIEFNSKIKTFYYDKKPIRLVDVKLFYNIYLGRCLSMMVMVAWRRR